MPLNDESSAGFARNASIFLVARIAQFGAYIVVLPAVTRLLDSNQYGVISLVLIVQQVLVSFADFGLSSVVAFSIYEREPDGLNRSIRLAYSTAVLAALVIALVNFTGPWWSTAFDGISYDSTLQLAVWMTLPMVVQACCLSLLQALGRPRAFVTSTLVSTVGGQALGLSLLWNDPRPASYLLGLLIGSAAGAVVAAASVPLRVRRPSPWRHVVSGIRHGGPTVPHNLAFIVLSLGDRVVVDHVLGLQEAARYQVAYLVGTLGFSVLYALNNAWAPFIFSQPEESRWTSLAATTDQLARLINGIILVIALGSPLALRIAAPAEYRPGGLVAPVALIVGSLFFDLRYLSGVHVLFRLKRTAPLMFVQPVAACVNIGLNLWLIPEFGLSGAAFSTLVGYAVAAALSRAAAHNLVKVPWNRSRELAAFVTAVAAVGAGALLPSDGLGLAFRLVAASAVAAMTIRGAWRVFDRETHSSSSAIPH